MKHDAARHTSRRDATCHRGCFAAPVQRAIGRFDGDHDPDRRVESAQQPILELCWTRPESSLSLSLSPSLLVDALMWPVCGCNSFPRSPWPSAPPRAHSFLFSPSQSPQSYLATRGRESSHVRVKHSGVLSFDFWADIGENLGCESECLYRCGVGAIAIAMATMRAGVVAPAFAEGGVVKGVSVRRVRIGRSSVWGSARGLGTVRLVQGKDAKAKGPRADMSGPEGLPIMPPSHRIKAGSVSAFQEFQNARANRYTKVKSSIMVLGLSIHTTPVEMREKLAVPEAEWPRAIDELSSQNHIEEAGVLSTCNRFEIYVVAVSWNRGVKEVTEWMSKTSGISVDDLMEHLFILRDQDATQHLFRVASGLDSLVLGEGQILAQVKQVLKVGQEVSGFGRNLTGLFKQAITAGKRVRTETNISAGAVSVSSAAVELAVMKLPTGGVSRVNVLIVGAGKMSKLLVKHLISKGCTRMIIVNRSEHRVLDLQDEFPDAKIVYEPLTGMLRCTGEADLVFTSTSSEVPLFMKENVENLSPASQTSGGVRHFIDIAVPRNVAACLSDLPGTRVYNVDDLKEVVAANKEDRRRKAADAQVIIDDEIQNFEAWRDSLETVPTIKKLRSYAERVRQAELEKCLSKMPEDLTAKQKRSIEDLSRGIVNKLLHGPMQHLRSDGTDSKTVGETIENMHALERMFDLGSEVLVMETKVKAKK